MSDNLSPSIYVACLAAYNNGYLHGCWIDANQDVDAIYAEIKKMLANSPIIDAEEWAIHDYEDFGGANIHEYSSIETVSPLAQFVAEHGDLGGDLLAHYGGDLDDAKKALEDHYHGKWDSEKEYATDLFDELYLYDVPRNIRFYIDYETFTRDLFINDYFSIHTGDKVHVFNYH